MRIVEVLAALSLIATGEWAYSWPYRTDGSCQCEETSVGDLFSFNSENECLVSFAKEPTEYCTVNGDGITDRECENSVSIIESIDNSKCQNHCLDLLLGNIAIEEFLQSCRFEPVVEFPEASVPVPGGCFTNFVLGHADYDPSNMDTAIPLKVLHEVDNPARCQHLCQMTKSCVWFSWRGACDGELATGGYQNPVGTCLLYDGDYVRGVFNAELNSLEPSPYCDFASRNSVCELPEGIFRPLSGLRCLMCDCEPRCVWKVATHIGGPVYCSSHITDICNIKPEEWFTTTSTEPACPEVTCPECATEEANNSTTTGIEIQTDTTIDEEDGSTKSKTLPPPPTECPQECKEGDDCNDRDDQWEPEDLA